jgi:hypothetical protein
MLFCITANYTPSALEAMGEDPNTNHREAFEQLLTALSVASGVPLVRLDNHLWDKHRQRERADERAWSSTH